MTAAQGGSDARSEGSEWSAVEVGSDACSGGMKLCQQ